MEEKTTIEKFYTCRWDKPFKEIFLKEDNRDLLTKLLEMSLHVEIYAIKELNVEKRVGNVYIRGKRVDIAHYTLRGEEYSEETKIIQINFTYGLESNQATKKLDF